jgi:predicted glutamine amidotransferase
MASGFAYQDENTKGYFKDAVAGSQLSLKTMPRTTKNVIVHTRLATHGSVNDNRNNHPVISPEREIALVHNGVIYNHQEVRASLPKIDFEVDTAVIPALIESDPTLKRLTELDGDAAIAWFDVKRKDTLNIARLEHSPLVMAQVEDGSLIFASTEALLWRTLIQLDLTPTYMETAKEYNYFQVRQGVIAGWEELTKPEHTTRGYNYSYYRGQTAGGKHTGDRWYDYDNYIDYDDYAIYGGGSPLDDEFLDEATELAENGLDPVFFYIKTRELIADMIDETYYQPDEYDLFKNDIWFIKATGDERELIDYGRVAWDSGELVSYKDDPDAHKKDVELYELS